ncbi:Gfo/Idh/MocA family protein [Pedobacter sp. L105]|uniref:Gfo/Idh/MocA family protein n=1 Tax=Pedobacter sp. L105 TaxID=1641871 RepID=UPI00131C5529|nr:Gfo/Idh/MocA family oxidoreductase [Pedobacter sp. L105]
MKNISRRSFVNKFSIGVGSAAVISTIPSFMVPLNESPLLYYGKKLNVAICGLGNYAEAIANGLQSTQYCSLSGIVTGTLSKAQAWKTKYNIPEKNIYNYTNFDDIINNKNIDLVYITLPNGMHKEFTIRAAKAGKHVITEKPMATSPQDCREMIKACNDASVQLAVGYRLHYEPTHLEIKRLGQDKVFGQVRYIEAALGYKTYDMTKPAQSVDFSGHAEWRLNQKLSGGGPLMDLGIYCIQASRYVLGEEPVAVTAQFGHVNDAKRFAQVEESISWQMHFPSGAMASCNTSVGFNADRFYASADEGSFELSPALSFGPFKGKTSNGEINFPVINQQQTQLDGICSVILENKPLPKHITGEEGLKDLTIIAAIYEAAQTGHNIII